MIFFEIPGPPQGKARARTFFNNRSGHMASITPEKTVLYENYIKLCYQQETQNYTERPVHIEIGATFEPPKSATKAQRQAMLNGLIRPSKKPDIDNIAKVILDALNGIAYKDDTQVISLKIYKKYGEKANVSVLIKEAGD